MNKIKYIEYAFNIKVRKYELDIIKFQEFIRTLKKEKGYSTYSIADILNLPLTTVAHWFRTDSYFSIPEPEQWCMLKELFDLQDTEFDLAINTFEEKPNCFDKTNRFYFSVGIAPTLTSTDVGVDKYFVYGGKQ